MPNLYPIEVPPDGDPSSKIWIIGEAPGDDEREERKPFVGKSGQLLFNTLGRYGIRRSECFTTNVSRFQPFSNKFENLEDTKELDYSKLELAKLLQSFSPNVIVCVGAKALEFITGYTKIQTYRGSILNGNLHNQCKTIGIAHPAYVLRDGTAYPVFDLDCKRVSEESSFPEVRLPYSAFILNPTGFELEEARAAILAAEYVAVDIETVIYTSTLRCVGFGISSEKAISIAYDTERKRQVIKEILEAGNKKILQNGIFDTTILKENGLEVNNYFWDTMVAQHILAPELPRGLDFLASIYTKIPYYKDEIVSDLYRYNAKDCIATYITAMEQMKEIADSGMQHLFDFEMAEIEMARTMSMTGLPVDLERREQFSKALNAKVNEKKTILKQILGFGSGELNVNPNSTDQMQAVVYDGWNLPEKRNRKTGNRTLDEDAVVSLIAYCKEKVDKSKRADTILGWKAKFIALQLLLEIRGLIKLVSTYIDIKISNDGRLRTQFKICSTETGRWSAEGYYDETGTNAQTFPREYVEV